MDLMRRYVKRLARVPDGGGHRKLGRSTATRHQGGGYTHIHTAIEPYSRLAYNDLAGVENTVNCVAFMARAVAWFAERGITIERILTDNGNGYRSGPWRDLGTELGIKHSRTKPYHPATAKSNDSTGPWPTNGPTPDSGNRNAAADSALTDSSTATTITDTTPPSAARPPAA
jgi:hypothetical protein